MISFQLSEISTLIYDELHTHLGDLLRTSGVMQRT